MYIYIYLIIICVEYLLIERYGADKSVVHMLNNDLFCTHRKCLPMSETSGAKCSVCKLYSYMSRCKHTHTHTQLQATTSSSQSMSF